jgi:hypothetical protein
MSASHTIEPLKVNRRLNHLCMRRPDMSVRCSVTVFQCPVVLTLLAGQRSLASLCFSRFDTVGYTSSYRVCRHVLYIMITFVESKVMHLRFLSRCLLCFLLSAVY